MAEVQLTILAEQILGSTPTQAQLLRTAVSLAQELVVFNGLTVQQKETVIVHVLEKCVQKSALPTDQKATLIQLLDSVIPETLKIILEVSNGEFSLKSFPTTSAGCFALCTKAVTVLKSDPQLLAIAEKKLASLPAAVTDVKVDVSGATVQLLTEAVSKLENVEVKVDVSGSEVKTDVSGSEVIPSGAETSDNTDTVTNTETGATSSTIPDVSGAPLTPEQAHAQGLFLDWTKKEAPSDPSV